MITPRYPELASMALLISSLMDSIAVPTGVANPIPSNFPDSENIEELIPISLPLMSISAPPEFQGLLPHLFEELKQLNLYCG